MRYLSFALYGVLFVSGLSALAQSSAQAQYGEAVTAFQHGDSPAVVRILEPIARADELQGVELGRVWLLLGSSYRAEARYDRAQHAYDVARRLLKNNPLAVKEYETALRESGSLSRELGHLGQAEKWQRASLELSDRNHDHAAIVRACEGLAEISLDREHLKDSERYIKRAKDETRLTTELDEDDRAYMAQLQGWIGLKQGDAQQAIRDYEHSVALFEGRYGENFALTGWGYMLLASAYDQYGRLDKALEAARKGVTILEHTAGTHDPRYATAEIRYADILDKAGQHAVAAQLKAEGDATLHETQLALCVGCTINVATLR
jgi:tetratricopeptide (TPR) repeat protein